MGRQDERAVAVPTESGSVLDGIFVSGAGGCERGAVVAAPHPLYGGSMSSPVVNEIAWACRQQGIASLRFDWRGIGASAGLPSGEAGDADADFAAALRHLAETVPGPLLASGYSFGAAAALRSVHGEPRVRGLLLVAPPPALLDRASLERFAGPVLIVTGERDAIAPPAGLAPLRESAPALRLEVVPEADHFFGVGLAALNRAATAFLERWEA